MHNNGLQRFWSYCNKGIWELETVVKQERIATLEARLNKLEASMAIMHPNSNGNI